MHCERNEILVLMGVAGCGKTTIGEMLSERLKWPYIDADDLHPSQNIEKVRNGSKLTDDDRWPWLVATSNWIVQQERARKPGIVSCSALKRIYRNFLVSASKDFLFVYLRGEKPLIRDRLEMRAHHFFPTAWLDDQFDLLEEPNSGEALIVDIAKTPEQICNYIIRHLELVRRTS